ncbi:YgiQ family radical SAM protein [Candidatus Pacearchaeota archaeon RBG_13_36_9]|nr:MAG: YgiQ family radical SAM protein [Candidatus Pacearchaeota archaeon RBG_13_36_9]
MEYDIIFVLGERYFDHPLCGIAILKRWLEKNGYSVGVIETPNNSEDIKKLGKPRLFFGVSSGAMDSMVRNYTALKREREKDEFLGYEKKAPDRAVTVYCNWIKEKFKDSLIVIGGTEATLRRFSHYDYWDNEIRKSILFDSRADILVYGPGEKQILEIAEKVKNKKELREIKGTCIKTREKKEGFIELPNHEEILESKEKFCTMQNLLSNWENLAQKTGNFYVLQYESPRYTSKDLDEYYELGFTRRLDNKMKGFDFSVVTHRGCIGNCNFCSLRLTMGDKIVSRSEESIIREIKSFTKMPNFKGVVDDLGGPSANMYGMDCFLCKKECINCSKLDRSNKKMISLLKKVREIPGVKKVFVRSGIRYDLANEEYLRELKHHISGKLKIAPEHVNKKILQLMNKDKGNLEEFIKKFKEAGGGDLAFYFMTCHPGSSMKEAKELKEKIKQLKNAESVQIFTPTPMTVSTCMYYTELNPATKEKIYVPKTFREKKEQKRILGLKDYRKK